MIADELRARRATANRLPPLPSGHRDPLSALAGQQMLAVGPAGARTVHEVTVLRRGHSLWLLTDRARILPVLLTRLGVAYRWDHEAAAWTCPARALDDLLALSEVSARPAFQVIDVLDLADKPSKQRAAS